ncbi:MULTISPECIES: STAS domain-containing protein [unclassified Streptomyces]|uniref:STAS domain-containing protein n=1 Tax=unclassified Streptomyces TaxID=2593676 RepID=UPI00228552E3|nr:STAS domain-containing protein [Streptomyces sp. Je 1-369]WAL98632.1 STAS domain-containing protein [Streptomyces sp. Je 1-369]
MKKYLSARLGRQAAHRRKVRTVQASDPVPLPDHTHKPLPDQTHKTPWLPSPGTARRLRRAGIARVLVTGCLVRVSLRGEITAREAESLAAQLRGLVQDGCRHLIVDLSEVTYLAREGAGVFFGTLRALRAVGGTLAVRGACPRSAATLHCLGMGRLAE